MRPQVSVVLPVYDDEEHVAGAIDRVLGQRDVAVELVIVDDGSPRPSPAIAAAAGDPRVTVVILPTNHGVAAARERGVREATAPWIWFVDSDDDWPPDAAATLLAAAEGTPGTDVVVAQARYVFSTARPPRPVSAPTGAAAPGRDAFRWLLTGQVTGHLWNKLFRRELLLRVPFTRARVQSDLALVAQALAAAGTVAFCGDHVYDYRVRSGSIITSRPRRAESLALIADAVEGAARRIQPPVLGTPDYRYFVARYLVLSGLKDAVQGAYAPEERARLLTVLRRRLGPAEWLALARRRDGKRLVLAVAVRASLPAYRRLLRLTDRRAASAGTA